MGKRCFGFMTKGFTLIEMLIALAIGATISVMTYQALDSSIRADEKVSAVTVQIDEINRAWQYFGSDLSFAVERTWVNADGELKSAMIGLLGDRLSQSDVLLAGEEDYALQFIRGDRSNPQKQQRSSLYMVGYRVTQDDEDGNLKTLWRDSWSPVDDSGEPKIYQLRILSGFKDIQFSYLPKTSKSLDSASELGGWPPDAPAVSALLPMAVRIVIDSAAIGKVERFFSLSLGS